MKRSVRVAVVLGTSVTTFVACFGKPDEPFDDSPRRDGGLDDGRMGTDAPPNGNDAQFDAPSGCTAPTDNFDSGALCSNWGSAYGNGSPVSRNGTQLVVTPIPGGNAGCQTLAPFDFSHGASLAIDALATSSMFPDHTYFKVTSGAQGMQVDISYMMAVISMSVTCIGGATNGTIGAAYSSASMRYWKFERVSGNTVGAFFSADAINWMNTNVTCTWSASTATVNASFGATEGSDTNVSPAKFDEFNTKTCIP